MRVKSRVTALLAIVLIAGTTPAPAQDESGGERILSMLSEVDIRPDSSLEVRETIRARAAGSEIRHGIYREFPTRYEGRGPDARVVPFEVVSVQRDGQPEPWHTAAATNGVRVYFGDKNTLVDPGEHVWVFTYQTDRQLGYFEDHDELYWNATGNGWVFPIDEVVARVTLPGDSHGDVRLEGYTGPQGSRERAYSASWEEASRTATFRATRALGPGEGLTVVVMWPKGVVSEPTGAERLRWGISDHRASIAAVLGLIAVLGYYLVAWARVGRDPRRGVIVVTYDPPPGLSPAAMRYLTKAKFDPKAFAATLVQMAVKGHLVIEETERSYTLHRSAPGREPLAPEENKIAAKLFGGEQSVALSPANHARVGGAVSLLQSHLHTSIDKIYLLLNRGYLATGVGLSLLVVAGSVLLEPLPRAAIGGFLSFWLLGWSIGVAVLLVSVVRAWRGVATSGGSRLVAVPHAIFLTLFAIPFVGAEFVVLGILAWQGSVAAAFFIPALAGVNALFHYLLKAPTASGRTILDRIEGFGCYLAATEADRINRMQGPQRTPALYEKLLPYAIALDLEERWSEQFADVLARAGEAGQAWAPGWYNGGFGAHGWSPSSFAGSVGGALSGAVSSSSTAPGSSSGGGGGGSSGGGGGGGGGGW